MKPTPRGGGVAIFLVCAFGTGASLLIRPSASWPTAIGYLIGASTVAGISFIDDLRGLSVKVRLAAQIVAAAIVAILLADRFDVPSEAAFWLIVFVSVIWMVGLTNIYNFMDGIDGLAAAQGLIAGLAWAMLATSVSDEWLKTLAIIVAASCLGFLPFNWFAARIFLGDVGSAFLGFTFAFLALALPRTGDQLIAGAVILSIFLFDASFTIMRRLLRHENILQAHRSHLYQRLVLTGLSPVAVVSLYAGLGVVAAVIGLAFSNVQSVPIRIGMVALLAFLGVCLWRLVVARELREPTPTVPAGISN